ncbi:MAG: phosphatase PAP2 family protein [Blastocatellia bacterium]
MKITLPAVDGRGKWIAAALWYAAFCVIYTFTGRFHLRPPAPLALWPPDRLIPFIDWTIWVYASQFLLLYGCFLGVNSARAISRLVYAISLASLLAFCVFLIYPTEFPRGVMAQDGAAPFAFRFLHSIDSAANCFPSLHVALAWLSALSLKDERRRAGALAIVWAALISISTLTTKQHYFVDLIGGGGLAMFCRWMVGKHMLLSAPLSKRKPSQGVRL